MFSVIRKEDLLLFIYYYLLRQAPCLTVALNKLKDLNIFLFLTSILKYSAARVFDNVDNLRE